MFHVFIDSRLDVNTIRLLELFGFEQSIAYLPHLGILE